MGHRSHRKSWFPVFMSSSYRRCPLESHFRGRPHDYHHHHRVFTTVTVTIHRWHVSICMMSRLLPAIYENRLHKALQVSQNLMRPHMPLHSTVVTWFAFCQTKRKKTTKVPVLTTYCYLVKYCNHNRRLCLRVFRIIICDDRLL